MSTLALRTPAGDPLRPQRTDGLGQGAAWALVAHALLVLALALGVQWRTTEPEGLSAELWAAVPQQAAPPPTALPTPTPAVQPRPVPPTPRVAPPPAPQQADIALDKQRQQAKLEADKKEADKRAADKAAEKAAEKKAADAKAAEARAAEERLQEQRLAKLREDNLRRMMGQAGSTNATGTATAGPSAGYAGRVKARVKPNIVFTDEVAGNPTAELEVRLAPDGSITGRRLLRSSGNKDWDEAVLRAIDRTEVLPKDIDGRVPGMMIIAFRPRD